MNRSLETRKKKAFPTSLQRPKEALKNGDENENNKKTMHENGIDRKQPKKKKLYEKNDTSLIEDMHEKNMREKMNNMRMESSSSIETQVEQVISPCALMDKPAPFFHGEAVVNEEFEDVSLDQFRGKYLVLLFYPMDFSYICPSDIIAFSSRIEEFRELNCDIIGISTDSCFSHLAWIQTPRKRGGTGKVRFPMLSDKRQEISKTYGVYIKEKGYSMRATFIIDTKGIIRHIMVYGVPIGRSVNETLRIVKANQYVDEEGEAGCQSEWQPGMNGVKFSVEASQQFFKTQQ